MEVLALFQFYLPYFLPRTEEWSEAQYLQNIFDVEGQLVHVHPRKANEELFPSPIDMQLADSKIRVDSDFIVPVGAPAEISVRDRCFDRIEAQVYGEVASREDCLNPNLGFAYRRSAISACNKFLYHCRVVGRDPEVTGLVWHYNFEHDRCYFTSPHSLLWFEACSKEIIRDDEGNPFWTAQSGAVRSPARVPINLSTLHRSLTLNDQPDLPLGLLVSAKQCLMVEQLHEGIVNLASACEIASTRYIKRKRAISIPQVKKTLQSKKSFAERRYHEIPLLIDGRSLKTESASSFTLLEQVYRTRNRVAHAGDLAYTDAMSGQTIKVTRSAANDFFKSCEHAIEWIENL